MTKLKDHVLPEGWKVRRPKWEQQRTVNGIFAVHKNLASFNDQKKIAECFAELQGGQGQGHKRVPLHVAHLGSELDLKCDT